MDSLSSYDELPYDRLPFQESELDFLNSLAMLHGFEAADVRTSRVLELGCAQGGNLIPMAARYPAGEFIGIDLSRKQIDDGQAFIARAGLQNIRLIQGDIASLPEALGEFDYIIAHGVYSWVPESVRGALLTACRRMLKPRGIAYVSFNVDAGWRRYARIRELFLQHDQPDLPPMLRVERARSLLEATVYDDRLMQKEVDYLKMASAAYLFHEYLSDINSPCSFEAFIRETSAHGLRYLGEAGPRRARVVLENDWGLSDEARHERWLEAEANLDEALTMRFRRALLVRDDAPMPGPLKTGPLKSLAFSAELMSDDELDFEDATEQEFIGLGGERFRVRHPLLKAFLVVLSGSFPHVLAYHEAEAHALGLAKEYGYRGEADAEFLEALLDLVQLHGVRLHHVVPASPDLEGHPLRALPLTRLQAASPGWPVTNPLHRALDIDDWGRVLLSAMDGSKDLDKLAHFLLQELSAAGIQAAPEQVAQHVEDYIEFFRRQGLMA